MQLHSDFEALTPRAGRLSNLLNAPGALDGGFARVVVLDDCTVLKATSCPATNLLFQELLHLAKKGQPLPEALPAVFKDHGTCVQDIDGIRYRVWEVERLFNEDEEDAMRQARVLGKARLSQLKPVYVERTRRSTDALLEPLNKALAQERAMLRNQMGWQAGATLAAAMAVRTGGAVREAFLFLENFIRRHRQELDLLTRGNLLLDMFGQPVFSDPVCEPVPCPETFPGEGVDASEELHCLVAETPVAMLPGFRVRVEHRSTFGLEPPALERAAQALRDAGLKALQLRWDDPRRLELLQTPANEVPLWDLPDAPRLLREGVYERVFHTC